MPTHERRARLMGLPVGALPDGRGRNAKAKGAGSPHWTGGRPFHVDGYRKLFVGRAHPLADPNGYTYEHLLVWVSAGRERPAAGFLLHHMNHRKDDNRLENLELISRARHGRLHIAERRRCERSGRLLDSVEHNGMPA